MKQRMAGTIHTTRRTARPISPARWVAHLVRHAAIARAGDDPEGVHQVRVAIARLRVFAKLCGRRDLDEDLRWLRDRAAKVRDLDVQLAQEPPARWARHLSARRRRAQEKLLHTLERARFPRIVGAVRALPPVARVAARAELSRLAGRALERGARAVADPELARLHRLRCSVRQLRYALEWLGEDASALVPLQEALGDVGDCIVGLRELARHGRGGGARRHVERLERELSERVRLARASWEGVRPSLESLRSERASSSGVGASCAQGLQRRLA